MFVCFYLLLFLFCFCFSFYICKLACLFDLAVDNARIYRIYICLYIGNFLCYFCFSLCMRLRATRIDRAWRSRKREQRVCFAPWLSAECCRHLLSRSGTLRMRSSSSSSGSARCRRQRRRLRRQRNFFFPLRPPLRQSAKSKAKIRCQVRLVQVQLAGSCCMWLLLLPVAVAAAAAAAAACCCCCLLLLQLLVLLFGPKCCCSSIALAISIVVADTAHVVAWAMHIVITMVAAAACGMRRRSPVGFPQPSVCLHWAAVSCVNVCMYVRTTFSCAGLQKQQTTSLTIACGTSPLTVCTFYSPPAACHLPPAACLLRACH